MLLWNVRRMDDYEHVKMKFFLSTREFAMETVVMCKLFEEQGG